MCFSLLWLRVWLVLVLVLMLIILCLKFLYFVFWLSVNILFLFGGVFFLILIMIDFLIFFRVLLVWWVCVVVNFISFVLCLVLLWEKLLLGFGGLCWFIIMCVFFLFVGVDDFFELLEFWICFKRFCEDVMVGFDF